MKKVAAFLGTFCALIALVYVVTRDGTPAEAVAYEHWFVVKINGEPAGYASESRKNVDGAWRTETSSDMRIKRMGDVTRLVEEAAWEEKPDGTPLRYTHRTLLSANDTVQTGEIKGGTLEVVVRSRGVEEKKSHPWAAHFLFPLRIERLQREKGWKEGTTYTYVAWNPQFGRAATHTVKVIGRENDLARVAVTIDILPNVDTIQWVRADGRVARSRTKIMGLEIEQVESDRATALASAKGDVPEVLAKTLLRPAKMPKDPRKVTRAVYRVTIKDGEFTPDGLKWDGQTVDRVDGRAMTITVDPARPPDGRPSLPVSEPAMEDFLRETAILQCHDKRVVEAAKAAVEGETDAWKAAKKIEAWTRARISKRNFGVGFATAAEVAERLEGDCTEHSVFAAAMARAVGLPSRIAVGLVAVGEIYGGHMWTEVWVGRWVPIDATLPAERFDATHIKMGESSGASDRLQEDLLNVLLYLGRMELEIVELAESP